MDDATEATTVRFEWNDSPDVSDVSRLLSRIEDSGEVTGVELEVEADGFDVPTLVGVESEAAAEDESLESQAADVPELATAPEKWGTGTPRRRRCGTGRLDRWLVLSVVGL